MKKFFLTGSFLFLTLFFSSFSLAREAVDRQEILKKVEDYFNALNSLKAGFVQSSSSGVFAEGTVYLEKENKLRLDYAPPSAIEVVADGHYLIFHDKKLGQVTHMDLDMNPASFMLKKGFSFQNSGLTVTDITEENGIVELTVFKEKEALNGRVRLTFSKNPFALKQWQVTDAQQIKTMVSLLNVVTNEDIDDALFKFKDPKKSLKPGDKGFKKRR